MSKKAAAYARIRQLANLGLPEGTFITAVLPELQAIVPHAAAAFLWLDAAGEVTNSYADEYFEGGFPGMADARNVVGQLLRIEVGTPALPLGRLVLQRGTLQPFGAAEGADALSIARYIAQGIAAARGGEELVSKVEHAACFEEELLVCDPAGEVVHATDRCRRMLLLATGCPITPASLPTVAARSAEMLRSLLRPVAGASAEQITSRDTFWGRFSFHVIRLHGDHAALAGLYGIVLKRQKPAVLRIVEAMSDAALSPQQRQIALMIVMGRSNKDIGVQLGVSINTVAYHVKCLFSKLDVHDRAGLLVRLLHASASPAEAR